jgi:uncharacterized protein (TIGR02266 family)
MTLQSAQPNAETEPCRPHTVSGAVERRGAPRVELNVGVGFRSGASFYTGSTSDISEGGLFVATHMLQPIGSELALTFALPTGPEISVRGRVRWVREAHDCNSAMPPGMGVQFFALKIEDLERIRELVQLREPISFEA